jgi:hypothetical protein
MKSNPHILERNKNIAAGILRGKPIKIVAQEYGISLERARQILQKYCKNINKDAYLKALAETNELSKSKNIVSLKTPSVNVLRKRRMYFLNDLVNDTVKRIYGNYPRSKQNIIKKSFIKFLAKGKKQGYLTYDDINETLPEDMLSPEQIDEILMIFDDYEISIIDSVPTNAIEEVKKTLKYVLKLSGDEITLLINLMRVLAIIADSGHSSGYVREEELKNELVYKFFPEFFNEILEKLCIKILDEKSIEEFETAKIFDPVACKIPANDQKILKHLISIGKKRGYITKQELNDIFTAELLENLFKMFGEFNIKIVDEKSILKK